MKHNEATITRLSARLGFWAAALSVAAFVVYTICFLAILVTAPLFTWTNMADYVVYAEANSQFFKHLAQFAMLMFGPLFVLLLNSIHDYAPADKKTLTRISLCFGVIFAALIGMHYFVQISAVRLSLIQGNADGLEQFVQGNPYSALAAINVLGMTLFLGLASLFIAPVFAGRRLEWVIRYAFLLNGIFCLLGGAGYVFDITPLVFVTLTLGMGAAVTVATVALSIFFRREEDTWTLND